MNCEEIDLIVGIIMGFGILIWMFINHALNQEKLMRDAEEQAEKYRKQDEGNGRIE